MKRLLAIAGLALLTGLLASTPASATGDDGWTCPDGTTYSYKIDDLSGDTFTVPGAPEGWEVLGASIKAGTDHYDYPTAVTGDVIAVKTDTGHATSHAHICKREVPPSTTTTTSTPSTSTTSSTSTTTSLPSTSTSSSVATTTPAPTTTAPASTSSSSTTSPTTSSLPAPTSTSSSTSTEPSLPASSSTSSTSPVTTDSTVAPSQPTTQPSSPPPTAERVTTVPPETVELPKTGSSTSLALVALGLLGLGGAGVVLARRD